MFKIENSVQSLQESKKYLAGGVASSLRSSMLPTPIFAERAKGAYVWDVDGNKYIDYLLAYGPLILGHSNAELTDNILTAMNDGYTYGLQHKGEIELAKKLTELLPSGDRISFSGSGTEAVMLALRLSRAHTGRQKIIRFSGHFHGWSDSIFTSFPTADMKNKSQSNQNSVVSGTGGQSEKGLSDIIVIDWNDIELLKETIEKHKNEIAAIITEPVMCNSGCIIPKNGYLEEVREVTENNGIVLIFDEVITGFRLSTGGAQKRFGITPDLTTVGKALGGGIAISAVAGQQDIMNLIETGEVSHLGTLNGNCVSSAAALSVISQLTENGNARLKQMEQHTSKLVLGIRDLLKKHNIKGLINHIGPVFHMMFTEELEVKSFSSFQKRDAEKYVKFAEILLEEGLLVRPSGLWYLSTAHNQEEIEETLKAIERALIRI